MFLKRQEIYMGKISTYIIILLKLWQNFNIYNNITQIVAKFQHSTQKTKIHGHMILYLCACNFMIIYDQKFNLHSTLHDLISTLYIFQVRSKFNQVKGYLPPARLCCVDLLPFFRHCNGSRVKPVYSLSASLCTSA